VGANSRLQVRREGSHVGRLDSQSTVVIFPISEADAIAQEVLKLYLMGAYFIRRKLAIPIIVR
jgi:hypothetical protein